MELSDESALMVSSSTILNEIATDNLSGASAIYLKAITYLRAILREAEGDSAIQLPQILRDAGRELIAAQAEMAPLYNLVASVIDCADMAGPPVGMNSRLAKLLDKLTDNDRSAIAAAAERTVPLIEKGSVILTISYSTAVRESILRHPDISSLKVIVPESRPMCEGKQLAKDLGSAGVSTVLIADMAFGSYLNEVDCFVCGADAVTEKCIVNKIGTAAICRAIEASGRSAIAVFSENKVISSDVYRFSPGYHSKEELTLDSIPSCVVENRYFETVPLSSFTYLVSNRTLYTAETLQKFINQHSFPTGVL